MTAHLYVKGRVVPRSSLSSVVSFPINQATLLKNGSIGISPLNFPNVFNVPRGLPYDPSYLRFNPSTGQLGFMNQSQEGAARDLDVQKTFIDPIKNTIESEINLHIVDASIGLFGIFLIVAAVFQIAKPI